MREYSEGRNSEAQNFSFEKPEESPKQKLEKLIAKKKEIIMLASKGVRLLGIGKKVRQVNTENRVSRIDEINQKIAELEEEVANSAPGVDNVIEFPQPQEDGEQKKAA
jgi:hypothetical protein